MPFYMEEIAWINESNTLCGLNYPPPYDTSVPKVCNRNSTDIEMGKLKLSSCPIKNRGSGSENI